MNKKFIEINFDNKKKEFFWGVLSLALAMFIIGWFCPVHADEVYLTPMPNNTTLSAVYNTPRPEGLHKALDIICDKYTPIRAITSGYVYKCFYSEDNDPIKYPNGNYVIIKLPNGHSVLYAHLQTFMAYPGKIIEKGQYFALSGDSGRARGANLHLQEFDAQGNAVKITFKFGINWSLYGNVYEYQSGK